MRQSLCVCVFVTWIRRVASIIDITLLMSLYLLCAGIKIVQQIAILMGCAVLPHLKSLVEIVENGLVDEQQKVRTITALSLAALAEAATPYGIEAFDSVLVRLWKGIRWVSSLSPSSPSRSIISFYPLP